MATEIPKNLSPFNYPSPVVCCGITQDKVLGVALFVIGILTAATAGWLFVHGFADIPPFVTGCALSAASVGLALVSIALLTRNSIPVPRK